MPLSNWHGSSGKLDDFEYFFGGHRDRSFEKKGQIFRQKYRQKLSSSSLRKLDTIGWHGKVGITFYSVIFFYQDEFFTSSHHPRHMPETGKNQQQQKPAGVEWGDNCWSDRSDTVAVAVDLPGLIWSSVLGSEKLRRGSMEVVQSSRDLAFKGKMPLHAIYELVEFKKRIVYFARIGPHVIQTYGPYAQTGQTDPTKYRKFLPK